MIYTDYLLAILIPNFDDPLRSTCNKDVWNECVPLYVVDRGVVGLVGVEISGAVLSGAQIHHTFTSISQ